MPCPCHLFRLLASVRLRSLAQTARDTAGATPERPLWLPDELWLVVCRFLARADWPAPALPPCAIWGDGVAYDPEMFLFGPEWEDDPPCGVCPDGHPLVPQTTDRPGHVCTDCAAVLPAGSQLYSCAACDPGHDVCSNCRASEQ